MKLKPLTVSALLLLLALVKLALPHSPISPSLSGNAVREAAALGFSIAGDTLPMRVWENRSKTEKTSAAPERWDVEGFELEAMVEETLASLGIEVPEE